MAPVAPPDVADAWEAAHKKAVKTDPNIKAAFLLEQIGPRIAAASLGMSDARRLKRWAKDGDGPREALVAQRLDALYLIVFAIERVYSAAVAARFLRSSNPQLADEAPLSVLAERDRDK